MADVENIKQDLDEIKTGVAAAIAKIDELKQQIADLKAQPAAATQEDLDALDAKTEEIKAALANIGQ